MDQLLNVHFLITLLFYLLSLSANSEFKLLNKEKQALAESFQPSSLGLLFFDDFDALNDTTSLKARGYYVFYRGTGPQGSSGIWFQGDTSKFSAYSGPSDGYVASDFNSVISSNTIDNWLVLPSLNIAAGDTLSFMSRSQDNSLFPDSIKVMYSDVSDSIPEANSWVEIGWFKVSTTGWEYKEFYAPSAGANARFAIRYNIGNAGPQGVNSDYIGIDDIMVKGSGETTINEHENIPFSIFPNPAYEFINVYIPGLSGETMGLSITNVLGQQVFADVIKLSGDNYSKQVDVSTYDKGVYFITLYTEKHAATKKLVVE